MKIGDWVQPPPGGTTGNEPYRKPNKAHCVAELRAETWIAACEDRIALRRAGATTSDGAPHCQRCERVTKRGREYGAGEVVE